MISFFTRPAFIGNRYPKHTKESSTLRVSSRIRGDEIAEYLGAKLNPKEGFENDVCIHVKPKDLSKVKDGDWLDYLDGLNMVYLLKERPLINVIACSQPSYDYLKANLSNQIVLIPSHHLNIEGFSRNTNKVTTAGYIGSPSPEAFKEYANIGEKLKEIGIDFKTCFNFKTRHDAIDFYMSIDVLVIGDLAKGDTHQKTPTKIINAGSFGVPTIAYPLIGYKEIEGAYIHAKTVEDIVLEMKYLKEDSVFAMWSEIAKKMAEKYHISNIAPLYKKLV